VKVSRKVVLALAGVVVLAIAAAILATGSGQARSNAVRVAVVADTGSLNDKGFNTLAVQGGNKAKSKLGVDLRVYPTATAADRTPNLQAAAQDGYGLVIANGVLFSFGPLDAVAPAFSSTHFVGIDTNWPDLKTKPKNVRGIQFSEQQAGYLVGYIAGLVIKTHNKGKQVVSGVGANKVPAIVRFLAGYKAGAKKANPGVTVLTQYANDPTFSDPAKCKETTLSQIAKGSGVIFEAAGGCGLGGYDAAKQKGVFAIGVDSDQGYLGPHMLTSATKHVEVAVYNAISAYMKNPDNVRGGVNQYYTVKNGGVGYGKISSRIKGAERAQIIRAVDKIKRQLASGAIKAPSK
jgi:basic membrane protein A and related proteins